MNKQIEIAVYMPDEEAKKFMLFKQNYDIFSTLISSGVFNVKNGSVVLHFDQNGHINLIQRADTLYNSRITNKVIPSDT